MLKNYHYDLYDIQNITDVERIFQREELTGLNVTIPYKEKILPYLNELSDEAEKTGAVNCILIKDGVKKGFNTDVYGFEKTLEVHRKKFHTSALILGDGGAAKAVKYVLEKYQIPYKTVSRKSELNFENLSIQQVSENPLIIQCTPVGTFPNVNDCLAFPFEGISNQHLIIDLIYNPSYTAFLKKASEKGAKTVNGLYMLEQQAEKNWEIWTV